MLTSQQINRRTILRRASPRRRILAGSVCLAVIAFFGLFWSAGRFDFEIWPYPCGFKQKYDLPCPACGMTTSVLAFAQGRVLNSFYIQPATALACCVLAIAAFLAFMTAVFGVYFTFLERLVAVIRTKYAVLALLIIVSAAWAVTLARALAEAKK